MDEKELIQELLKEIYQRTSRSGGKGGQHVNKTESKVEILFDVQSSAIFSANEKEQIQTAIRQKFPDGIIKISSQSSRSQHENKEISLQKLARLLLKSLVIKEARKATKTPKGVKKKRKEQKMKKSEKKQRRNKRINYD